MNFSPIAILLLLVLVGVPVAALLVIFVLVPVLRFVFGLVSRLGRFVGATVTDVLRLVGIVVTGGVFSLLSVGNVLIGRWSRAQHFGRAVQGELTALTACLYRLLLGHPVRLLGMTALTEGLEQRLPRAMDYAPPGTHQAVTNEAPGGHVANARSNQFPGYQILGTLPGGGSGSRLYVARPDAIKHASFERQGLARVGDVVIKAFSLSGGSPLSQIVREGRALEAAKKLGLVLEHELTNERFYYVMRYVPGDSLALVTQRLHAAAGPAGLKGESLVQGVGLVADLLAALEAYHRSGLWHKDVKPDNIIVASGRAHLVDFGLVTPLRSSLTLTTHGTEYFRDPEMVRLALKGVKVHEVDGAKFDIYAAGAVLYSVIEDAFPAHGGLSLIAKHCPEALRWIVRRAMTEYDKRYASAGAMLADLTAVLEAARAGRAEAMKPAELPSVREQDRLDELAERGAVGAVGAVGAGVAGVVGGMPPPPPFGVYGGTPDGRSAFAKMGSPADTLEPAFAGAGEIGEGVVGGAGGGGGGVIDRAEPVRLATARTPAGVGGGLGGGVRHGAVHRRSAADQLASARARAAAMRERASTRLTARRAHFDSKGINAGVWVSAVVVAAGLFVVFGGVYGYRNVAPMLTVRGTDPSTTVAFAHAGQFVQFEGSATLNDVRFRDRAPLARLQRLAEQRRDIGGAQERERADIPTNLVDGARLLVIDDRAQRGENLANDSRVSRLKRMGFALMGINEEDSGGAVEDVDELTAQVRTAVGLHTPTSQDAAARIATWLAKHRELAGVVWVSDELTGAEARGAESGGRLVNWTLVLGRRISSEAADAALIAVRPRDPRSARSGTLAAPE